MKKKMICAASAVMLLTLSGCGLKGPLYFPPAEPAVAKSAPADNADVPPAVQKNKAAETGSTKQP